MHACTTLPEKFSELKGDIADGNVENTDWNTGTGTTGNRSLPSPESSSYEAPESPGASTPAFLWAGIATATVLVGNRSSSSSRNGQCCCASREWLAGDEAGDNRTEAVGEEQQFDDELSDSDKTADEVAEGDKLDKFSSERQNCCVFC